MSSTDYRRKVYSCIIQNDTDGDIRVVLLYEEIKKDGETKRTRSELDVSKGQKRYTLEKIVTCGTYNIREVINHIEVTLANGKKLELNAPFDGVTEPVSSWLFIVDNTEIKSVGDKK